MPLLDVSDIITDPDFYDTFEVLRRQEQVSDGGVSTILPYRFVGMGGVVIPTKPDEVKRGPDGAITQRTLTVITLFRLRGTAQDEVLRTYQPDVVIWDGGYYLVRAVDPYTRYGAGYVEATCEAVKTQDLPPDFPDQVIGAKVFTDPRNADLVI